MTITTTLTTTQTTNTTATTTTAVNEFLLFLPRRSRDDLYAGMVLSSPSSSSSSSHIQMTSLAGSDGCLDNHNNHPTTSGLLSLDCVSMSHHIPHDQGNCNIYQGVSQDLLSQIRPLLKQASYLRQLG